MALKNLTSGIYIDAGLGEKSKARYKNRRNALMQKLTHPTIIFGVESAPGDGNPWVYLDTRIYQEPLLLYLTGVNQLKTALWLDPTSPTKSEILFVAPKNPALEFWEGLRFGTGTTKDISFIQKTTGIKHILPYDEWPRVVSEKYKKTKKTLPLGLLWHERLTEPKRVIHDSNQKAREEVIELFKKHKWETKRIVNIADTQWDLRLPLDKVDIQNTKIANDKTAKAFRVLLKNIHLLKDEAMARGLLDGCMQMQSAYGLSFPTIAASGKNATVLHYTKNNDRFGDKELLLLDFGTRWMSMHADISRTFPINGTFNPLQKILYQIVLDANLLIEKTAKAGITIKTLNEICWSFIETELKTRFSNLGGKFKLHYQKAPHGVSHLMGEQEHDGDPFGDYKSKPMKAGWLISNEPGIYGDFKIRLNGKSYDEAIGIRIEDNLLITEVGNINLSKNCPKAISDLEKIMKEGRATNKKVTIDKF